MTTEKNVMKRVCSKLYSILILLGLFWAVVSCEYGSDSHNMTKNICKIDVYALGNVDDFSSSFYLTYLPAHSSVYDEELKLIQSPYRLDAKSIDSCGISFYAKFFGKKMYLLTFSGTAYNFVGDNAPLDTLEIKLKGYLNDTLFIDTSHVFRSFYKKDAAILHDSIQKWNNFQIKIPGYI